MPTAFLPRPHTRSDTGGQPRPSASLLRQLNVPGPAVYSRPADFGTSMPRRHPASAYLTQWQESSPSALVAWFDRIPEFERNVIRFPSAWPTARPNRPLTFSESSFTIPPWIREVATKMLQLLELPENWDSYGAERIRPECADYAINSVLGTCMQASTPAPAIVPLNAGGVMLEWHCRQIDLEVRIEVPGQVRMYFADARDDSEFEEDLGENMIPLLTALSKLTQRA